MDSGTCGGSTLDRRSSADIARISLGEGRHTSYLADATKHIHNHVDEPNMKDRHHEVDCAEVSRTRSDILATSLANLRFGGNTEMTIQNAICRRFSVDRVKDIAIHHTSPPKSTSRSLRLRRRDSCPFR